MALAASLVVVHIIIVVFMSEASPRIIAGYYNLDPTVATPPDSIDISPERRQWLEKQLAPSPVLAWKNKNYVVPDDNIPGATSSSTPQNIRVASVYLRILPDLESLSISERKEKFISIVLPLVLRANNELIARRQKITEDAERGDVEKIKYWAELYLIKDRDRDIDALVKELLIRVDTVPVSIVLAQSAIESGWGTSRFARQGNALFGQWAWTSRSGLKPNNPSNKRSVVRSFVNLFDSTRAYMHNLNTHDAYKDFRKKRVTTRGDHSASYYLIHDLDQYAEDGLYVQTLANIIDGNGFRRFDDAALDE